MSAKFFLLLATILGAYLLWQFIDRNFVRLGVLKKVPTERVFYLRRVSQVLIVFLMITVCLLVLGLGYGEVSLFLSSVFAVLGVALFAQWSILSNITASFVIFFFFPYRVGYRIQMSDEKDKYVSGTIKEITLFHLIIQSDRGAILTIPNTLVFQKAVSILSKPKRLGFTDRPVIESDKALVGSTEFCDLPELEISKLSVRVDTGAKTSSLHVDNIEEFEQNDEQWIRFEIHPDVHDVDRVVQRQAKLKAVRNIVSSNATKQKRYVIDTELCMGDQCWQIELTLTDRSSMTYLMLLGREAMNGRLIVDPEEEYRLSRDD